MSWLPGVASQSSTHWRHVSMLASTASREVQSPYEAPPAPDGATGIHVVNVRVD